MGNESTSGPEDKMEFAIIAVQDDTPLPERIERNLGRLNKALAAMPSWRQNATQSRSQFDSEIASLQGYIDKLPFGEERTWFQDRLSELTINLNRFLLPLEFEHCLRRMNHIKLRVMSVISMLKNWEELWIYSTGIHRLVHLVERMEAVGLGDVNTGNVNNMDDYRRWLNSHRSQLAKLEEIQRVIHRPQNDGWSVIEYEI